MANNSYAPCPNCGSTSVERVRYTLWGGFIGPLIFHLVKCNDCGKTYNGKTGGKKNPPVRPEIASSIKPATLARSQVPQPGQLDFYPETTETNHDAREQEHLALLRLYRLHTELVKAKSEAEAHSRRWGKPVLQGCLVGLVIIMVGLLFSLSIPADNASSSLLHTLNNIGMLLLIGGGFYLIFRHEKQKTTARVSKADTALQAAVKEVSQQLPSMLERLGGTATLLDQGRVEDALSLMKPPVKKNAAPMPAPPPAAPKEERWEAPDGVRKMLEVHIARLSKLFQGRPEEQETLRFIRRIVADELLTYAVDQISQKMPESLAEKKAIHTTGELGEWFMAITICPWLKPEEVKAHLGQGYMELLDTLTRSGLNMPGGRNIAHWIYCSDGEQAAAHLTLIPNPQGTYIGAVVLAQDLLTPLERQQAGLPALSGQGVSSVVRPAPKPIPGICFQCHKPLKAMAGGVYVGANMMAALEQIPYPCKSCGTQFCVECMAKIKQEHNNICPYCKQNNGW